MGTAVALTIAALLSGASLVAPTARQRALAMLAALVVTPVLLIEHVWGSDQLQPLADRPALAAAACLAALALVAALTALLRRRPEALAPAVVIALPFRIPIASGGSTANLLVPLYLVIAAGVLAYAFETLRAGERAGERPEPVAARALEWALAAAVLLYAVQAAYSDDTAKALENTVFFYIPFTLMFALLARLRWTTRLVAQCLAVLVALSLVFAAIGAVEYATRHLLLNPKVIASNQFESYFRVNSLFFDPNIYGRFLATVMIFVAAVLLWTRRRLLLAGSVLVLALLWGALLLTFSQSSFAALLLGLAVLGALRWSLRLAAVVAVTIAVVAIAFAAASPSTLNLDGDNTADDATSGRVELIEGGLRLFEERPLVGHGSGSFSREYRRSEQVSSERAVSASHTTPVTIAAEQGVAGLVLYLALLGLALARLLRGAGAGPIRAGVAAAFVALVLHTLGYAAFLEDPITWALLGAGAGFARLGIDARRAEPQAPGR